MGKKANKFNIFLIILLFILLIVGGSLLIPQTILPSSLYRQEYFPNIDIVSSGEAEGVLEISEYVNLDKIYKLEFIQDACSTSTIIYLDNIKVGEMKYKDCELLFYDDGDGIDYIHYQTQTLTYHISDLRNNLIKNYNLNFKFINKEEEGRTWVERGETHIADEPFNQQIKLWERAQCTSTSQCIPITIIKNNEEEVVNPFCSRFHKCSINLDEEEVEDVDFDEELIPITPMYIYLLYGGIMMLVLIIIILLIIRRKGK